MKGCAFLGTGILLFTLSAFFGAACGLVAGAGLAFQFSDTLPPP